MGTLGLVMLSADNAKGDLDAAATQHFLQRVNAAQGVPVVELGPSASVLADLGKTAFDRDAALALGEKQELDAFFTGEVQVTKVKPQVDMLAPLNGSLFARATVDMSIKVRLVSCKNGATLWTRSATREGTVGSVGLDGGVPGVLRQGQERSPRRAAPGDHLPADLGLPLDPPAAVAPPAVPRGRPGCRRYGGTSDLPGTQVATHLSVNTLTSIAQEGTR